MQGQGTAAAAVVMDASSTSPPPQPAFADDDDGALDAMKLPSTTTTTTTAKARPRWLSLLMAGGALLLLLSAVGAVIGAFHEEILQGIYWCQRKKPWSDLLYGVLVIVGAWLRFDGEGTRDSNARGSGHTHVPARFPPMMMMCMAVCVRGAMAAR